MVLQGGQSMSQRLLAPCGQVSQKGRHGGREQDKTSVATKSTHRDVFIFTCIFHYFPVISSYCESTGLNH